MEEYDPDPSSRGLDRRTCRNCGEYGREHSLRRVGREGDLVGFTFQCPDTEFEPDPDDIPMPGEEA